MNNCDLSIDQQTITLWNSFLKIQIDRASGNWKSLVFTPLNRKILAEQNSTFPLEIGLDRNWLPGEAGWSVEKVDYGKHETGAYFTLKYRLADLEVHETYTLLASQPILVRNARVIFHGSHQKSFWGALFRIPAVTLGEIEDCEFFAPGQSTLSRIPFIQQASVVNVQPVLDDIQFRLGPGKTPLGPLEPCPDFTPGVIGIYNKASKFTFLAWFFSQEDTTTLSTQGYGSSISITHHHRVEGWADVDKEYSCGSQYIALLPGNIPETLAFLQGFWSQRGIGSPPDRYDRCSDLVVFETSIQMEGGFPRFSKKLPHLKALGINLLYLLPIWLGTKVTDDIFKADNSLMYRLDPNWQRNRIPHRIISHDVLDPAVGDSADVTQFIRYAHDLGIKVIFDLVFHGVAPESPLLDSHPEWFQRNLDGKMFPSHSWIPSFSLDWANPEVQDYFINFACRNVREFDIDGYRIDAPFAKESNWDRNIHWRAGAAGFGGVRFVNRLRSDLKAIKPGTILLCEMAGPIWDTMCDLCNDDPFLRMCLKVATNDITAADLQVWLADRMMVGIPGSVRILSIENHNSTRVSPSSFAYRNSPVAQALFTICCFSGGVPLIWSGQEKSQYRFYRKLFQLRQAHPALSHGTTDLQSFADSTDIFVVLRNHPEEYLLGLINCGSRWKEISVEIPGEYPANNIKLVWTNNRHSKFKIVDHQSTHTLLSTIEPFSSSLFSLE